MTPTSIMLASMAIALTGTSLLGAQTTAPVAPGGGQRAVPMRRVMAPPAEKQTALKLRPSTAEAGEARTIKKPLQQLPSFAVTGRDNLKHDAAALQHTGHWLLLYRTDHCAPCDRLMITLAGSHSADFRRGTPFTVVVGGEEPSALDTVRATYDNLGDANWVADRDRSVRKALQLTSAPVIFGMDGNRVVWRVAGTMGDAAQVSRLTDHWIAGTGRDAAIATKTTGTAPVIASPATTVAGMSGK